MLAPLVLLLALAADGPVPPPPPIPPTTGTVPSANQGQRVSRPLPVQSSEERDESAAASRREYRAMDERRRGPDGNRDQILSRTRLRAVDGNVEDRSALDDSLRLSQPELLSTPTAFNRVYIDPANPNRYMRGNGALFITFPYSDYRFVKKKGTFAFVPGGTTFRIGMPAHFDMPQRPSPFADAAPERTDALQTERRQDELRVDARVDLHRPEGGVVTRREERSVARNERRTEVGEPLTVMPRILADERYRRAFFESLRKRPTTVKSSAAS